MMDPSKNFTSSVVAVALALLLAVAVLIPPPPAAAQVVTSCTTSMISSFTPCLNYLTGSINGGASSPTADCCDAIGGVLSSSSECACLLLTGNVPFSLPINRTLAVSLPRACKSKSVPVFQCKGSATVVPPAGAPVGGPALPALPPFPTAPSVLPPPAPPSPAAAPSGSTQPGVRGQLPPLVLPNSAVVTAAPSTRGVVSLLVSIAVGAALLSRF